MPRRGDKSKERDQMQRLVTQHYSPINKHYFLAEDKQWISFVCSVKVLITRL